MLPLLMIEKSPIAAVVSDPRLPDNPIVECNAAFIALTGYSRDEIVGRNCRFLRGSGSEPELCEALRIGVRNRQPVMVEILNYKKDGTPFRNAVMVAPIFDAEGELEYFLGSQAEVADYGVGDAPNRRALAIAKISKLSKRQNQVLLLMTAGKLNKQIAFELGLNERTVKMHRFAVLKNLEAKTNADAIRLAIEAGY